MNKLEIRFPLARQAMPLLHTSRSYYLLCAAPQFSAAPAEGPGGRLNIALTCQEVLLRPDLAHAIMDAMLRL